MSSDSKPKYSLSSIAILISSAVRYSGISVHDSVAFMVLHIPIISLFVSWLCLDSQLAINNCGQG